MSNDQWRYQAWDNSAPAEFARKLGIRIQDDGVDLNREEGRTSPRVQYMDLVQMFADCAEAAVDEHIRRQREKAEYVDAHKGQSGSPEDRSETPHRISAQSIGRFMIIGFFDGSDFQVDFRDPIAAPGWVVRNIRGVHMLIIGHGVPRKMFPLSNIRYIDIVPEEL